MSTVSQIDVEYIDSMTKIAARDGLATLLAVAVIFAAVPILWIFLNRIYKKLNVIDRNTKGFISDETLKDVLRIYVSDIRNKNQSFIYNKIEKNHIVENYENYIENEIPNKAHMEIHGKREALTKLTTYNNISQFSSITEKNLNWHIKKIKDSFAEKLAKQTINYDNLRNVTNKELELFEQETINQLNKIF